MTTKKPKIKLAFVGLSPRSKLGCESCRFKKKKCDEVHPVCGLCKKRGVSCVWDRRKSKKRQTDDSSMKVSKVNDFEKTSANSKLTFDVEQINMSHRMARKANKSFKNNVNGFSNTTDSAGKSNMNFINEYPTIASNYLVPTKSKTDKFSLEDDLRRNMARHISSPNFDPSSSVIDSILNNALTLHNDFDLQLQGQLPDIEYFTGITRVPTEDSPIIDITPLEDLDFLHLQEVHTHHGNKEKKISKYSCEEKEEDDDDDDDSKEVYLPMDESQMLENVFLSENELLTLFKSKTFQPYLKPAIHALFNRNDILNIIKPESAILSQLDSNGVLFLDHYISYLASNVLDIGNKEFFLDYAVSAADQHKSILYCIVGWGGMFLLGRDNSYAKEYLEKSRLLIEESKEAIVTTEDLLATLSCYVLFLTSEITTGDVSKWYQMLLHCKDLINRFGGLQSFVKENKVSTLAKWILSSIFFHDVLSTRTLEFGTIFPIEDYHAIMKEDRFLLDEKYGLDPFYGLSYELYLILGTVVNKRKEFNQKLFGIGFLPSEPREAKCASLFAEIETHYQEFDLKITHCKPPKEMIDKILLIDSGNLLELHHTLFELTQIAVRIFIRISFVQKEFTDTSIQKLKSKGDKLFNILIGTKLQTMLCFPLLMLGIVSVSNKQRNQMQEMYEKLSKTYEIKNVAVSWEIIKHVWTTLEEQANDVGNPYFVDWTEIVTTLGWNCCFS